MMLKEKEKKTFAFNLKHLSEKLNKFKLMKSILRLFVFVYQITN